MYQSDRSEEQRSRDRRKRDVIVIAPSEHIMPTIEENVDMFVTDTVAVDVEPRVEKPTVASTSTDVAYVDAWYDQLFDDLNYRRTDKEI